MKPYRIDRRDFLRNSAARAAALAVGGMAGGSAGGAIRVESGESVYLRLVGANDARIAALLATEPPEVRGGPAGFSARAAAYRTQDLAAAYCAPESRYRGSPELICPIEGLVESLIEAQHPDGTIDSGNLQSPPDTAFVVEPLCVALANLNRYDSPDLQRVKELLERFILAAGEALVGGGVHTPNHRWGVCAALARVNSLYPASRYVGRIDEWLSEGVDIDADGQYSERSVGIYSAVTNIWLITAARLLRREELLEPVRRNLELTLYHMHPNGELEAIASRRQDQWRLNHIRSGRPVPDNYYLSYRYMALRDGNGRFAAAAGLIEEQAGDELAANLGYFLEEPLLREETPPIGPLPSDYAKFFPGSGLVRIRRGKISASVYGGSDWPLGAASGLASNPTFFTFRKGDAVLESVRMAPNFFSKGFFYGDGVEARGNRYSLRRRLEVPYYQPLPRDARRADGKYELTPAEDRFWSRMDFPARRMSEIKTLDQEVTVIEREEGRFEIEVSVFGHEGVAVALELCFRRGGRLFGTVASTDSADEFFLERGMGRYEFGDETIEFGPGRADHRWTRLEGAAFAAHHGSIRPNGLRVYIAWATPVRTTIAIR